MKNIAYISLAAAVGLLSACDLDAPNQSTMEEDVVFSTEELADAAVMGLHQSFGETNSYRGRYVPYFGTNTDCEIYNNFGGVSDPALDKEASLANYNAQVDNSYMNTNTNAWAKLYEGIERANKAVYGMETYADLSNANLGQIYGELLTLRGMIYYDLVKAWGDVPYRFDPISSETLYLPQTDRSVVLKRVMDDLEKAENYLGWPNENKYTVSTERVSKAFAKGLRARIAMFLAGKSEKFDGSGLQDNWESIGMTQQELWTIAYNECKDVIEAGRNQLGNFEDNFRALCQDDVTAGKESLFEIPFSDGRGRVLYTWGGKHTSTDQWTSLAKGGVNGPTPTLWYDFDSDDVRRNITCLPYVWTGGVKTVTSTSGGGWCFGKLRFEWMSRLVTSTNDDGINYQVMRLADVYMLAAEAANELNNLVAAKSYLKPVLDRALPAAKVSALLDAASTHDAFFNLIVDQRRFEFAGEGIRKVDLIRWGLLKEKLEAQRQAMKDLAERTGAYANYPRKIYYAVALGQTLDGEGKDMDADGYYIYGLEEGQTDEEGKDLALGKSSQLFNLYTDEELAAKQSEVDSIQTVLNGLDSSAPTYSTTSAALDEAKSSLTSYQNNNNKIINMQTYLFIPADPNTRMFWPIWSYFINSSNGMLVNGYGY